MSKRAAQNEEERHVKRVRLEVSPGLSDPGAWDILERFLTTDRTYEQTETEFIAYLGDRYSYSDWVDVRITLFSGDGDDALSLSNLRALRREHIQDAPSRSSGSHAHRTRMNPFIDLEAGVYDDDEDDIDVQDGPSEPANLTILPAAKHRLSDAIDRIEGNVAGSSRSTVHRQSPVATRDMAGFMPSRMYVFSVHVTAREFLAEYFEKKGFSVVVSPWIPAHLYVTSDSPRTVMAAVPESHKSSIKRWDRIQEHEEAAVNALRLKYPYPAWLRIKRGKYKDAIAYIFDSEQTNNFVTVLIPPRQFPYNMPKDSVALFDPSRLPTGILATDIIRDGEVVGLKYKGEEYYGGLLKKTFHRYCTELVHAPHPDDIRLHIQSGWDTPFAQQAEIAFSKQLLRSGDSVRLTTSDLAGQICTVLSSDHAFGGSVNLEFDLDGQRRKMEARLVDVERVFNVGDEVRVVAGVYLGLEGHVVQKYGDIFHICQSGTQEMVEVSKYYLDRRPNDRTLQAYMSTQSYVDPPQESKSVEIGDYIEVVVGDLMGKSGLVQWATSDGFVWFQDEGELLRCDDRSGVAPPLIKVQATMVDRTRLPATIKFTRERGYDVKPGDVVSIARGPEYRTEGVVHIVDFPNAQLTLETNKGQLVNVPIRFVMKARNSPLDDLNRFIKKEVFVIGGPKKGFRATLYDLSTDTCTIAVHGQPRMTVKRCDVATSHGCRLNGAMLEWSDFTLFSEMRRKSYLAAPPRSVTPPPDKIVPLAVDSALSSTWADWSPQVLAAFSAQPDDINAAAEDPWTVNPSDSIDAVVETSQRRPRDPICWLAEFAIQFHTYHALFQVSAGFQSGKLVKRLANSHCPDPFCGPNGLAPPGCIAAWCTAKTAGGARVDYHIPFELLTPAPPRKKNQECFIMDGEYRGGIRTVAKCNTKNRTVELRLFPTSKITVTVNIDDVCLVEPSKHT